MSPLTRLWIYSVYDFLPIEYLFFEKKIPSFSILIISKIVDEDITETPCPLKLANIGILDPPTP